MGVQEHLSPETESRAHTTAVRLHQAVRDRAGVDLPLRLWDGTSIGTPGDFRIVLHHPWSLRALLLPPSDLTAGEAYVEQAIDIEGDMVAAMRAGARLAARPISPPDRLALLRMIRRLPRPPRRHHQRRAQLQGRLHSLERDRAAIAFHYDLPQAFYEQFLDDNLVYSCAYFLDDAESLEAAQERKLDVLCRKLRLKPGDRLLDIGCGWGSLLIHAAKHYGIRGVGVTLSETQTEAGTRRIAAAGLSDAVEIRLQDYRELDDQFDAVVSVGMFEHVGGDHLDAYFRKAWDLLRPGGLFCNHGIVTGDAERESHLVNNSFAAHYVFPDGSLVPVWRAVQSFQGPGFQVLDVEQLRPHYALTLREWVRRLEVNREAVVSAASESDYRIWRAYMAGSAHSFEAGSLGVVQILGARANGSAPGLPLGRAWMAPRF